MLPRFQLGRFAGLLWCLVVVLLPTTATAEDITEDPSTWFVDGCVSNPDTLTNAFGKDIPQTCIDVPYLDDGSQTQIYQRCYYTYVPDSCFATPQEDQQQQQQLPLVMDLHGLSGCPLSSAYNTGWMQLAEKDCFVLVWPSGDTFGVFSFFGGNCWNLQGFLKEDNAVTTAPCCCLNSFLVSDEKSEPDDPLFLKLAIDHLLESSFPPPPLDDSTSTLTTSRSTSRSTITIDPNRVYMAGHSNGCMASMAMAALYPDSIAAVCCHAGAVVTPFPEPIDASPSVPIFWVHGKKDATVPFDGQTIIRYPPYGALGFWSVEESLDYLSDHYGCLEDETVDLELDNSNNDDNQTTVVGTIAKRTNCRSNATIELMVLENADHYPYKMPDSVQEIYPVDDGASPVVLDTTAMAWEFCRSHVKPAEPQTDEPMDPAKNIPTATTTITTQPPEENSTEIETEEEPTLSSGTALRFGKSHERMLLLVLSWSLVVLGWVR